MTKNRIYGVIIEIVLVLKTSVLDGQGLKIKYFEFISKVLLYFFLTYALELWKGSAFEFTKYKLIIYSHLERRASSYRTIYTRFRNLLKYHLAEFAVARVVASGATVFDVDRNFFRHFYQLLAKSSHNNQFLGNFFCFFYFQTRYFPTKKLKLIK